MSSSPTVITRRRLLTAAGGMTFIALARTSNGLYASTLEKQQPNEKIVPSLPLFTALPYIQPGVNGSRLVQENEGLVIAWQTNQVLANYSVEYGHNLERKGSIDRRERMRVLSPLFEQHGVDVVLHGHEHTYQRTRPLRFEPTDVAAARRTGGKRLVPGKFSVDRKFDGVAATKPDGILYITTGAGGKELYDPHSTDSPAQWLHAEDNNVDYIARFISDRHSLTVFDMDHHALVLAQVDEWGREVGRCRITKA